MYSHFQKFCVIKFILQNIVHRARILEVIKVLNKSGVRLKQGKWWVVARKFLV